MPLALVRTDPLDRLLADLAHRLAPEEHDALRRRFERRRRIVWYRVVRRALRRARPMGRRGIRDRARAFPRAPRDDLDLSLRRIRAARASASPNDRRLVTRRRTRAEVRRLLGDADERVVDIVVDLVTDSFYPHLP